jgi:uncharacterized membrane protein YpjA
MQWWDFCEHFRGTAVFIFSHFIMMIETKLFLTYLKSRLQQCDVNAPKMKA